MMIRVQLFNGKSIKLISDSPHFPTINLSTFCHPELVPFEQLINNILTACSNYKFESKQ